MSREAILQRIRAAVGETAPVDGPGGPPVLPDRQPCGDPVALFAARAGQVGVRIDVVASATSAAERAVEWCAGRGVTRVAVWSTPDVAPLVERLRGLGIDILGPGAPPDDLARADIGITGAAWGIAETGTLVLPSGPGQPRLVSLLPPVHLAVLHAERILPDLHALFGHVGTLPSALTFITGPSRSADIGLVPVLGAHGPIEVTVLLIQKNDTAAERLVSGEERNR
jgi:L-lactate dehydrogenase complex protein LldG